jgi:glyoxylase-like metal-dependent hydrolase (beta-lactamase superfamily II)
MKTILLALALTFPIGVSAGDTAGAPAAGDSTLASYQQARAVLARALEAAGGEAAIRRLRNVSLDYAGHRHMINQSRRAFPPWDREPASGSVVVDREGERMFAENYTTYPGIGRFGGAWALKGDRGVHWEPDRNHHGSEIMMNFSGKDADGPWAFVPRWIPPLMLIDAWDSGTHLRSLGRTMRGDTAMHALVWTQRDGATVTLLFDAASGAFSGYESVHDDGVYGDVVNRIEYSGWRDTGGLRFPTRRTDWSNDEIARDLELRYRVDNALADSRFELPAGYTQPMQAETGERLRKIGEGVYLDTHMGGIMIVEFDGFLAVVDCPGNYSMSQSTILAARVAFPDKPVRYVVPSHTHGDHGGGARAYFHAGATLVTTPGHAEFYRQLARVSRTISPDPYDAAENPPSIETFRGKKVISDGKQTMVLHDIGPNAHSEELTIVHLPRQGIVWQADAYFSPGTGGGVNPAMPIGIDFARKLKSIGIDQFQVLLEGHNTRMVTLEEFRSALALSDFRGY